MRSLIAGASIDDRERLRRLEAQLILADTQTLLLVSGDGEIIEPDNDVLAIGSGGSYALAAARALLRHTQLSAAEVARAAPGCMIG